MINNFFKICIFLFSKLVIKSIKWAIVAHWILKQQYLLCLSWFENYDYVNQNIEVKSPLKRKFVSFKAFLEDDFEEKQRKIISGVLDEHGKKFKEDPLFEGIRHPFPGNLDIIAVPITPEARWMNPGSLAEETKICYIDIGRMNYRDACSYLEKVKNKHKNLRYDQSMPTVSY